MRVREQEPDVWLIAGPTASGKSALALRLAEAVGATVVNADSMQVYRDLRVLSARPSAEEQGRAPHRLYGHVDAAESYSVGRWQAEALGALAEPGPKVLVGGTGLYLRALTHGLADIPPVPEAARAATGERLGDQGEAAFRAALRDVDPEAEARIEAGDRQRLIRAGAVHDVTGRALSAWRADTRAVLSDYRAVVIEPERGPLYRACDARFIAMLAEGALEEVAALADRALPPDRPALKAVGVRELSAHLQGRLSLADATAAAQRETRRYAKRQLTWLRNQSPDWPRLLGGDVDGVWRQFVALHPALTLR